uniref:RRM domain-containing protein n=1 Tax=Aotus nancymaae TaxID=37293 RepID=A0A2K5ETS1_AOTNA
MKTYRQREKQRSKCVLWENPRNLYEDELVPLFEKSMRRWDLHLMMDPLSSQNRGYAFITFLCISVANNRLFVGSILKNKTKENILEEFSKVTEGLVDIILYHQPDDKKKNRGFCFLEYEDHKSAAQARCRLMSGKVKEWENVVTIEWADPVEEPDLEVMAKVKVLCVRNMATTVTEEILEKSFFGKPERVKKLKDYAFVHCEDRGAAVKVVDEMNAARQASRSTAYEDYYCHPPPRMPLSIRGWGRGEGRGGYGYPPDYYGHEDYYDDYCGYDDHDYRGSYEDPYYGYGDGYAGRGRGGGRGGRGAPPPLRGRGAPPPRGRVRGVAEGTLHNSKRCGSCGPWGNGGDSVGASSDQQQNWGSQPITQQPVQQGGDYSGNYGYSKDNQEFYQDTYGQQWK